MQELDINYFIQATKDEINMYAKISYLNMYRFAMHYWENDVVVKCSR
jgi:hypothetical protein